MLSGEYSLAWVDSLSLANVRSNMDAGVDALVKPVTEFSIGTAALDEMLIACVTQKVTLHHKMHVYSLK